MTEHRHDQERQFSQIKSILIWWCTKCCKISSVLLQKDWVNFDLSVSNCPIIQQKPTPEHGKLSPGELTYRTTQIELSMSFAGQDDIYISHLIECAISENVEQETHLLPGTSLTVEDSIEENQVIQVNSGPNPIVIQRHFGANDRFCLGPESGSTQQDTLQSTDCREDYSIFVIPKPVAPITVNAFSENPPHFLEISDDEENLIDDRRKAENSYFQQFMSSERSKSSADYANLISNENASFVKRNINQEASSQYGSNRNKAHSKTFCKPRKKNVPKVNLAKLVRTLIAKDNRQSKVTSVNNDNTLVSGQSNDLVNESETANSIELREIEENTYLKHFLDLCNTGKQETKCETNTECKRKTDKRNLKSANALKSYRYPISGQIGTGVNFNKETPHDSEEKLDQGLNSEQDFETFLYPSIDCPNSEEGNDDSPFICGYCGCLETSSTALDQHLESEHSEIVTNAAQPHESENEYWRLSKKLVEEQRKRDLERREEEKRAEENRREKSGTDTDSTYEQSLEKPKSKKRQHRRGQKYTKQRQTRRKPRMSNKEKENSCVDFNEKSGSPLNGKPKENKDENDSDDDIEIIEPTIELVVIDSSDDNDDSINENKTEKKSGICSTPGTPSKIVTLQNKKLGADLEMKKKHKIIKSYDGKINTNDALFKGCSVNLSRMKVNEFDRAKENFNCKSNFTLLETSKDQKVNKGNAANTDCKVMLDRVMLKGDKFSFSRVTQKESNLRHKKDPSPVNSMNKNKTPQCSVSLEKLSPQNLKQTDMNNIIKYLISCETQNKDKLLMQKYGIKDVSVNVPKAPTISEEVSKFFSREHYFTKLDDNVTLSEFSRRNTSSYKPDDQISWVSNRSVSPQPSTSSGHSYIPCKRTARKSTRDNTRSHALKEPKVILQNLSSIDIALLKNPNSSYRKSNWLNMFSEESSDSDDNTGNKIPIKSLLDNLDEGVNENNDVPNQKKGKGKAVCRKNQGQDYEKGKSDANPLPDTIKQETADIDLLKKFGITRSIVVLQDKKSKGVVKVGDKVTKCKADVENCIVIEDDTSQKVLHGRGKGKRTFFENKKFVRKTADSSQRRTEAFGNKGNKDFKQKSQISSQKETKAVAEHKKFVHKCVRKAQVSSRKENKAFVEHKKIVRKVPIYSPTALSLIRSLRFKKSKSSISLRGSQSKNLMAHSLETTIKQKKPQRDSPMKVNKATKLKTRNKFNSDNIKSSKKIHVSHIKKDAQHISVRSQKSSREISNLNLCKPFSINLTSIDRKNVIIADLVNDKLTNTTTAKEEISNSEKTDSEIEFSIGLESLTVKNDSEQTPEIADVSMNEDSNSTLNDRMDYHESKNLEDALAVEKTEEIETEIRNKQKLEDDSNSNQVVKDTVVESCSDSTENIDIGSRKIENDDNEKVTHKRELEEHLVTSPPKRKKLSKGKEGEDTNLASLESSTILLTGECYSVPGVKQPDKIPNGVIMNPDEKQVSIEENDGAGETECGVESKNSDSLGLIKGKSIREQTNKKQCDLAENIKDIANDVAIENENFESLQKHKNESSKENSDIEMDNNELNCTSGKSIGHVNEGLIETKINDIDCNESRKDSFVGTDNTLADGSGVNIQVSENVNKSKSHVVVNSELDKPKLVAQTILHNQSLKGKQHNSDKKESNISKEVSKSNELENKEDTYNQIKETPKLSSNSGDIEGNLGRPINKRNLDIIESITVLNDQENTSVSSDKENEVKDSKETKESERTENDGVDSVDRTLPSPECELSSSSGINVMDNQTKDVVGTCYIHQTNSDS